MGRYKRLIKLFIFLEQLLDFFEDEEEEIEIDEEIDEEIGGLYQQ